MEALRKAKLALRKYIEENPKKVKKDLTEMRKKSESNGTHVWFSFLTD